MDKTAIKKNLQEFLGFSMPQWAKRPGQQSKMYQKAAKTVEKTAPSPSTVKATPSDTGYELDDFEDIDLEQQEKAELTSLYKIHAKNVATMLSAILQRASMSYGDLESALSMWNEENHFDKNTVANSRRNLVVMQDLIKAGQEFLQDLDQAGVLEVNKFRINTSEDEEPVVDERLRMFAQQVKGVSNPAALINSLIQKHKAALLDLVKLIKVLRLKLAQIEVKLQRQNIGTMEYLCDMLKDFLRLLNS